MHFPSWQRFPGRFTIVFGVVLVALFVIEQINGRFWLNDFRVYYGAGGALLAGDPLYGVAHGLDSGFFKYAPVLALFYAPFSLLPYGLAASLQFALIAFAFVDGSIRVDRMIRERFMLDKAPNYWPLFITALVCVVHLHRELHLGNINMILLWVLLVALDKMNTGRTTIASILIGLAILAKPHFIVLLPLFFAFGKYRQLGVALITMIVGIVAPALVLGPMRTIALHGEWLNAMAEHNAALIYTHGDDLRAVNTVYSLVHRGFIKYFMAPSNLEAYGLLLGIAGIGGAGVLWLQSRIKDREKLFNMSFLVLVALVPSITLTDTEHFLFALPLVAYLVHHLFPKPVPAWLIWPAIVTLFAYGGNWEDALGTLSGHMIHFGVLGMGNVALIVLCIYLFLRSNQIQRSVSNR